MGIIKTFDEETGTHGAEWEWDALNKEIWEALLTALQPFFERGDVSKLDVAASSAFLSGATMQIAEASMTRGHYSEHDERAWLHLLYNVRDVAYARGNEPQYLNESMQLLHRPAEGRG